MLTSTTTPLPILFLILSAKSLSAFPSTSSKAYATAFTPFISFAEFKISSSAPEVNFDLSSDISLSFSFNSAFCDEIFFNMSFSVHFNPAQASLKSLCLSSINLIACIPVTASILLIPAATPVSATILNNPISPTFET